MHAAILLVCLALVQISWVEAEADHEVFISDGKEVIDRHVREGEGKVKTLKRKKRIKMLKKGMDQNGTRQSNAECSTTMWEASKKYNVYLTQVRKARRIESWVEQMDKKKEKARTTFKNASDAIMAATENGTQCDGKPIPNEAKVANDKLQKCSETASEKCSSNTIDGLNPTLTAECIPKLDAYVKAYKVGRTLYSLNINIFIL